MPVALHRGDSSSLPGDNDLQKFLQKFQPIISSFLENKYKTRTIGLIFGVLPCKEAFGNGSTGSINLLIL
jgi:hypothetical protein